MKNKFNIYLRALEPEDYKISIIWRNDDEIWSLLTGQKYFVSSEYEKNWVLNAITDTSSKILAICLKNDKKYIGNVYLKDIDYVNRTAQFNKLIGEKSEWGKGYGVEVTMLMLEYGFYELGLNRIWAYQLETNIASIKVNEKCGFKKEGVLREAVYKNGEFKDKFVMAVLRKDFDKITNSFK